MKHWEEVEYLTHYLLEEMPHYISAAEQITRNYHSIRLFLRSLMNVRPPIPLKKDFLVVQDKLLTAECEERGIVEIKSLLKVNGSTIYLWQGDITRLRVDGIVNAANNKLLGCFYPCHSCIDNAIHSAAGLQLRDECNQLMGVQGHDELTGRAKITRGYNLPSQYVLHTVGPIVFDKLKEEDCLALAACYSSCLEMADKNDLQSIAFCCVATGEYHFPNKNAAEIALRTVQEYLFQSGSKMSIIFNVFKESDYVIYRNLLAQN